MTEYKEDNSLQGHEIKEIPLFTVNEESFDGLNTTELLADLQRAKQMLRSLSEKVRQKDPILAEMLASDNQTLCGKLAPLLSFVLNLC